MLLPWILGAGLLVSQDYTSVLAEGYAAELRSNDVARRQAAAEALRGMGPWAIPVLEACTQTEDPEVVARARDLLGRLKPLEILFSFDPLRGEAGRPLAVRFRLVGTCPQETVYFRFGVTSEVHLLELFETPACLPTLYGGGWARASTGCLLSERDFAVLSSGRAIEMPERDLRHRAADPLPRIRETHPSILGWAVGWAGRYRITARYRYDRSAYLRRCPKGCSSHSDPSKLWNRCEERSIEAKADFLVTSGFDRCDCGQSVHR